jgi:hypothetical protein
MITHRPRQDDGQTQPRVVVSTVEASIEAVVARQNRSEMASWAGSGCGQAPQASSTSSTAGEAGRTDVGVMEET